MSTTDTKAPATALTWPDRAGFWWLKDRYGQALAESFRHDAEEESESPFAVVTHQGEETHHGPFMARDFDPSAQFLWLGEDFTKADVGAGRIRAEMLDEVETAARSACCTVRVERDYNGQVAGSLVTDSGAISTNAEWLRSLAAAGRFRIVGETGRMVVGYWPENDPSLPGGNVKMSHAAERTK